MKKRYTALFFLFFGSSLFSQASYLMGAGREANGLIANALNGWSSIPGN